jgi:hypothetical protein
MNNPDKGLVLNRFKVQVLTAALHSFTVVATSPQEAFQKVTTGQGGVEAGREGPSPIAINMTPLGVVGADVHVTLQQALEKFVVDSVGQNQARQAQSIPTQVPTSLIQVTEK